jgi:hypothetical protein
VAQPRTGDPGRRDTPAAGRAGTPTGRLGSTVASRYRLDEPRSGDLPGSERWTATDQILARKVTVTLVSGPRTAAVLDAARRAALVVDPRLARILDVGSADGTGYVVTEAVQGRSLAALASRAPLTADQARAVVGEAAAALEVARRRGVHHLALRPEAVVLTSGSRVVLEGLAVDGELIGASGGGAHAMSRTDTVGLVRVLYAALTGRWPAASAAADVPVVPTFDEWSSSGGSAARQPSGDGPAIDAAVDPGLPAAPEHAGAPLPPADLVAGVPADLDTLCAVTLGPHDDGPHSPGELVRELEPWRAVRADEIFHAADAGRWPALPAQAGPPASAATGTTTAPPTGSSPMSDDQNGSTPARGGHPADDSTPATGSPAGAAAVGAAAASAAAASGAAAGASGQAGAGAGAAGAAAGTAAAGAAASGKVARQSVRSAFTARPGAGARRPGTPPPAAAPASFPPAASSAPQRTTARPPATSPATPVAAAPTGATAAPTSAGPGAAQAPAPQAPAAQAPAPQAPAPQQPTAQPAPAEPASSAVPPARSASPAEPAPATPDPTEGGSLPPAIPPASRAPEPGSSASTPGAATEASGTPAAAELAVAGITAVDDGRTDGPDDARATDPAPAAAVVPTPVRRTSSVFGGPSAVSPGAAAPAPADRPAPAEPVEADASWRLEQPTAVPAPVAEGTAGTAGTAAGGDGPSRPEWDLPFPSEGASEPAGERRFDPTRWVLGLVALAVVIGVVVALANVLSPFRSDDDATAGAATQAPVATAPPAEQPAEGDGAAAGEAPAAVPPVIAGVNSIDPSDGDGEHEELVGRLVDGDPATTWYTHTYNRPDFAGFKDAVGLVITLQAPATVTSVTLDVNGAGGNVEVRSTDAANPTAGDVLAAGALAPQTVLTLAQPTETQSIVLWFTSLSQTPDGQNRIEISNVAVS